MIARVDFYQGPTLVGSAAQSPYTIPTTLNTPGTDAYSAKAVDNAGPATQSGIATITVLPNAAPTAALVSPVDSDQLTAPATIRFTANATDGDGTIANVEFYQGAILVATLTQAPSLAILFPIVARPFSRNDISTEPQRRSRIKVTPNAAEHCVDINVASCGASPSRPTLCIARI
jgi:hypothetical protein